MTPDQIIPATIGLAILLFPFDCPYGHVSGTSLNQNFQILLVLSHFAITVLFVEQDTKCIHSESKTLILIFLSISLLIFGIAMILNNFGKRSYQKLILPCTCSVVIYMNIRYVFSYVLFININDQKQLNSTEQKVLNPFETCYAPIWFDIVTLISFHMFLLHLYFYMRCIYKRELGENLNSKAQDPKLTLPSYSEVERNANKFPSVVYILDSVPTYQQATNILET
ncbi:hypothetical protein BLOT_015913 [Blomia tropicalis]|nr:hypothetical protein BLOT_015913 [Blomia tropicalis]